MLPEPRPGMVFRYAYLWRDEAKKGKEEAAKDRPCVVVLSTELRKGVLRLLVAPVTHSRPEPDTRALELPLATKQRLRLDDFPSWIITSELNSFLWVGPDVRFIASTGTKREVAYGYLPEKMTKKLIEMVILNKRENKLFAVDRTE